MVERVSRVWEGQEDDSAGAENAQERLQPGDWVLEVLEHVIGDDEVDRIVSDRGQRLGIVDDVRDRNGGQVDPSPQEVTSCPRDERVPVEGVDVANARSVRETERTHARADLDAGSGHVPPGEIFPSDIRVVPADTEDQVAKAVMDRAPGDTNAQRLEPVRQALLHGPRW